MRPPIAIVSSPRSDIDDPSRLEPTVALFISWPYTYNRIMSDNYTNVLLEDINAKFDQIIEVVGTLSDELKTKASQESVDQIQGELRIVKTATTDTSNTIRELDHRVAKLES